MFISPPGLTLQINNNFAADPGATQLTGANAPLQGGAMNVCTVANGAPSSCILPPAVGSGKITAIANVSTIASAGNIVIVFPQPNEQIGTNAVNAGQNCTLGRTLYFCDLRPGVWSGPLTA